MMNIILYLALISLLLIVVTSIYEFYIFNNAPFLNKVKNIKPLETSLSVIIPTYNEEKNIKNCLKALSKIEIPSSEFKIYILDDSSIDNTLSIAEKCKEELFKDKSNIQIVSSGKRPQNENWVGKNWACYVGSKKVNSEFILFIDADVIVEKYCIYNALSKSFHEKIDLLSLAPKVNCNCLAEWMVQPIMTSLLMLGFPISDTNNPKSKTAFAAGPFMLFRKDSYESIGGHEGTHNEIVEDLALARKIKDKDLKLNFLIAIEDISLNMYKDLNSLLEGWSKNWYLGLEKNIFKSLLAAIFVFSLYSMPWLLLIWALFNYLLDNSILINNYIMIFSLLGIISYGSKRYLLYHKFNIPYKYWFLNGIGGLLVIYISISSIYKTLTGNNWTWKGRKLSN